MKKESTEVLIDCVGVDNKLHVCYVHSNICKCSIKVKTKKIGKTDYQKYSCYECTF